MGNPVGKKLRFAASKTEEELLAMAKDAPEVMGVATDEDVIVFNGKVIGLSKAQKALLEKTADSSVKDLGDFSTYDDADTEVKKWENITGYNVLTFSVEVDGVAVPGTVINTIDSRSGHTGEALQWRFWGNESKCRNVVNNNGTVTAHQWENFEDLTIVHNSDGTLRVNLRNKARKSNIGWIDFPKATTTQDGMMSAADKVALGKKADLVSGKVPASQLPSYVDDVVEFGSVVSGAVPVIQQGKSWHSTDEGVSVVYMETGNRFAVTKSGESGYYGAWADADTFGEAMPGGVQPVGGKIYVDTTAGKMYRWSGTQLVNLSASLSDLPMADVGQAGLVSFVAGTGINVQNGGLGGATSSDMYQNPDGRGMYGAGLVWFDANVDHGGSGRLGLADTAYDGLMRAEDYKKLRIGTNKESFGGLTVDEQSGKLMVNVGNGLLINNESVFLNVGDAPLFFGTGGNEPLTINVNSSLTIEQGSDISKLGVRLSTAHGNNPLTVSDEGLELRYGSVFNVDENGGLDLIYGSGLTKKQASEGGLQLEVQFGTTLEVLGFGGDLNVKLHKSSTYPNGKGISNAGGDGLGIDLSYTSWSNPKNISGLDFDESGKLKVNAGAGITTSRNKYSSLPDGVNVLLSYGLAYANNVDGFPQAESAIMLTLGTDKYHPVYENETLAFAGDGGSRFLTVKYGKGLTVRNATDGIEVDVDTFMQAMTQAEYDALEVKDANKLYLITDAADATGVNVE